jgi:type II secretory ATPase GspE/PulE/Tfp pilus assembly ATPase PilB-like protein
MNEIESCKLSNREYADTLEKLIPEIEDSIELYSYEQSALHSALLALQEKAEREKGCEYCKGKSYRDRKLIPACYSHTPAEIVIDTDNALYISNEAIDISINTIKINYCPMCGRKLTDHIGEANGMEEK